MSHPLLGKLEMSGTTARATVAWQDTAVALTVDADGASIDTALALAARVAASLQQCDAAARDIIARDLLGTWHDAWREYDEPQDDGSLRPVTHMPLDAATFKQRFVLESISVTGADGVALWYGDADLFWGHHVRVSTCAGGDFCGADAQLMG